MHPLLYVWNHRVHVKSDLPPKARAQTSNLYEVTASFVFQSFKLVVPLFVWCSASVMLPDSSKQILHGWARLKNSCGNALYFPNEAFMEILAAPRLWLKPHWSSCALPVRVFWLKMTRAGALSNLVADQPQKVFVETSIANNFFLFSFMPWIFFRIAILACLSHIWEHEILFPKLLESKALHFRDSDFAHLRGWENLFPSLPSRKSTSEGAPFASRFAVCHKRVFLFLPSLWIQTDFRWEVESVL